MKIKLSVLIPVFFLMWFTTFSQASLTTKSKFKIVGYYSLHSAMSADLKTVPFDQLTHINLYFLNPDTLGSFTQDLSSLASFIKEAHRKKVKVLFSIAGGGKHEYYHNLLKDDKRSMLINNLVSETLKYNLDGVDVDIEGSDIDENYEKFVGELARSLRLHKKLVTAAIAVFYKDVLTDAALAQFDFMNVMSYDHTGPWAPQNPGPHSLYAHASADLEYFRIERKIPKEKLVLGVGFYGYGFGPELTSPPVSMSFKEIIKTFPGAELTDQWYMPGGMIIYYNGIATIQKKTKLAKEKASGVMIWQIQGDASGSKSLLKAINEVAYDKK
jgi:GH18 family chitinase